MKRFVLLLGLFSAASHADTQIGNWNITIQGKVLASSCDLESVDQTVSLGHFSTTTFKNVGDTSTDTPVKLLLKNCGENIVGAKVTFSGVSNPDNPDLLVLSVTHSPIVAQGVGVELMDTAKKVIPINSTTAQYPLSAGDNTLNFLMHYKATKIPVSGGSGTAVMYFDMSYQ
ncbi:TPA: fimbrial protein [Enterobacter cancerogenus]|nr:fimbrial protein [Enterobacter cancerogenus]HDR2163614.1 fimbrial protein [Enterobacter cancerogenus]HDR2266752.1 fimbrial protein [Enterobacter cancerogenus]